MKKLAQATLSIFLLTLLITSCRTKGDTTAIISVRGIGNQTVSNAEVRVYGTGTQGTVVLNKTATTNTAGEAQFNFNDVFQLGQAGVAVVDIEVKKDGEISHGIMKIEQETTNKETVYIGI